MKILKYILILWVIIFHFSVANAEDKTFSKVAVVDVESILENSVAIAGIKKSMSEITENPQKEIEQKEQELKKYEQELVQKESSMDKEKFDELVSDFNKKVSNLQKNVKHKKAALDLAHAEAIEAVNQALFLSISEIANKYNINVVLPSNQVLYASPELNITLEVITHLNEKLKNVPINYEKFLKQE